MVTEEATDTAPWDVNNPVKSFLMHRMLPEMQKMKPVKGDDDDIFVKKLEGLKNLAILPLYVKSRRGKECTQLT